MVVQVNLISRALPYALLTLIAIAGWTMDSPVVLAMVVFGVVGVSLFPAMALRKASERVDNTPVV